MPRLILSPHLDDAVFSAFHTLDRDAVVATLCTASPNSDTAPSNYDRLTRSSDPSARYEERRAEDLAVAAAGGWRSFHCGLVDFPYRKTDPGPDPGDIARALLLEAKVSQVCELWAPAGIGGHLDHILTRSVGLELQAILQKPLHLYADLPYAANFGWPSWITGMPDPAYLDIDADWRRWLPSQVAVRSDAVIHRLDKQAQERKLEACAVYRTQFAVSDAGPSRLLTHPDRIPVEVSWRIR